MVFSIFFGTPYSHLMSGFTGPRTLRVPGEHIREMLGILPREKSCPDKKASRQKGQKHRQKGQKSRQKGQIILINSSIIIT